MPNLPGCFRVAGWNKNIIIVVDGYATQDNSFFFREFVEKMLREGFQNFIIDFSLCKGMDSTFMGVLPGILNFSDKTQLTLVNLSPQLKGLLDGLGLSQILTIKKEKMTLPNVPLETLAEFKYSKEARIKMILEAHKKLVAISPENAQKFGDFIELLSEELAAKESIKK